MSRSVFSSVVLFCGTWAIGASAQSSPIVIQRTIPVGIMTNLGIQMTPESVCTLQTANSVSLSAMKMYANDRGVLHFSVKPPLAGSNTLDLNCTRQDGGSFVVSVVLTATSSLGDINADASITLPDVGVLQPALGSDPALVTPQQLKAAGYPPKPDPIQSPQLYKAWSNFVTKPSTLVTSKFLPRPAEPKFMTQNSPIWVGTEQLWGYWEQTAAAWTVPELFPNFVSRPTLLRSK